MRPKNYYDLLGIDPDATDEELRSAYYIRARVIHPDRFDPHSQKREWQKANEMLAELNEAYSVLRDATKRLQYDEVMGYRAASATSGAQRTVRNNEDQTTGSSYEKRDSRQHNSSKTDAQTEESAVRKPGPIRLTFSTLPSHIREKLLDRQKGKGRHFSWQTKNLRIEFGCVIGALIWIGTLFYWTDDYRWTETQLLWFGSITIVSSLGVAIGILGLWRWKKFPIRGAVFVTPLYFIKCRFNNLWYWGLWQVATVQPVNHYLNGSYTHTTVTFIFDEGRESIKFNSQKSVEELFHRLDTWNAQTREALTNGNWEYFAEHDDFFDIHGQSTTRRSVLAISLKAWSIAALIAIASGLALSVFANGLNRYFDDKRSWNDAAASNRVAAYRKYLQNHPTGSWAVEANQRIQQQYDASFANYQRSRTSGFDDNASAAMLSILTYAKRTQHYRVRVAFERHNEIPTDIERQLEHHFEVNNVLSIGDSFSDDNMRARERQILSSVMSAVNAVIPEDVLEFTDSGPADQDVTFIITYKVKSGKSLYFRDTDSQIAADIRPYYPGVYVAWDFEIRIPSQRQGYRFSLESNPASEIRYAYSYGSETRTVYDRMAESAFEDFRRELIKRLGFSSTSGPQQTHVQPTPSPTPDISGTYTNEFGSVDITPEAKGFAFALSVGTGRCSGEIAGKAKWKKPGYALSRVALDQEVYEDPSSSYYQKTCQLTFRFQDTTVQIAQTDACTYFHGAECDFNGTYRR